jgi:hypothetical protein
MHTAPDAQPEFHVGDRVCLRFPSGALTCQIGVIVQVYVTARGFYKISVDGRSRICHAGDLALVDQPALGKEAPAVRSASRPEQHLQ